jgi:hypothetical protein
MEVPVDLSNSLVGAFGGSMVTMALVRSETAEDRSFDSDDHRARINELLIAAGASEEMG